MTTVISIKKQLVHGLIIGALILTAGFMQPDRITAQGSGNQRFGLVNAYGSPQSAASSGAGWEVITLHWDELQPDSAADWKPSPKIEEWLNSAHAAGREVVAVVVGTPAWATDGTAGIGVPRGLYLPVNDANNVWSSFVRQVVSQYASGGINHWLIWDAPDVPANSAGSQWEGSTEDYYQLLKTAYWVAKQTNPSAVIHTGGMTENNPGWFSHFLDVAIGDPTAAANNFYFDDVSVQVFNSPDRVYTLTANPTFVMNQKGVPIKPVWITQTNARPGVDPAYPSDTKFRNAPNTTADQQAAFIIQAVALGFAARAERIAVYQMADNLDEDGGQAFGLVRASGDPRPALAAYQLAAQEFNGFVFARRVEEQTHPLIEYVRLTFPDKVTHVAWAITAQTATLTIPARSQQATLIRLDGEHWTIKPQAGLYQVVVGGATCNDPATFGGCMIGGDPWILVEEGVPDPINSIAPGVTTAPGGELATPDPGPSLTATALAIPTATSIPTDVPTAVPTLESAPTSGETAVVEVVPTDSASAPTSIPEAAAPALTPDSLRPGGLAGILPYLLMGAGIVVIGGGVWFFFGGGAKPAPEPPADQPETTSKPKRSSHRKKKAESGDISDDGEHSA
jgi:hypothetical protein